jgi:hypothetical protein
LTATIGSNQRKLKVQKQRRRLRITIMAVHVGGTRSLGSPALK